jgi:hypothetical protein
MYSPPPVDESHSALRPHLLGFDADHELLQRCYSVPFAPDSRNRMREFYQLWQQQLAAIDFAALNQDGRVDYLLLRNYLQHRLRQPCRWRSTAPAWDSSPDSGSVRPAVEAGLMLPARA